MACVSEIRRRPQTGSPVALLDGTEITAVRTGACSALSVRLLAREDASVLAVIGTGVQARSHARAVVRVRPIAEVLIAGRDPAKQMRWQWSSLPDANSRPEPARAPERRYRRDPSSARTTRISLSSPSVVSQSSGPGFVQRAPRKRRDACERVRSWTSSSSIRRVRRIACRMRSFAVPIVRVVDSGNVVIVDYDIEQEMTAAPDWAPGAATHTRWITTDVWVTESGMWRPASRHPELTA